ncbi:MAG: double-strand break repair protein AddB, partial [Sphingomonadales bacterium]
MTTLFENKTNVFTIPAGVSFIEALIEGIGQIQKEGSFAPQDLTIFLPTRRAIRIFQQHITMRNKGHATLLPTLRALGDVDEDDLSLSNLANLEQDLLLAPAISPLKRTFLLQKELQSLSGSTGLGPLSTPQRLLLAGELARLLDQFQNQGTSPRALQDLVAEKELAEHWQYILDFLGIITKDWPKLLKKEGAMDPVARRTALIDVLIKTWKKTPPKGPVIAAGSTGSVPSIRNFLKAIATLPEGIVILPGLDLGMDIKSWEAVGETHPQYMMKQTLEALHLKKAKVKPWPFPAKPGGKDIQTRLGFVRDVLAPAEITGRWHKTRYDQKKIIRDLDLIEAPTPREEAGVIALILRHALETPGKHAALVTPDRALAKRVSGELRRWNIAIDDTAGTPLTETPAGAFFLLAAEMVVGNFAPVPLLALLKHPLTRAGSNRASVLKATRALDENPLRGARPAPGLDGLLRTIASDPKLPGKAGLVKFLKKLERQTRALNKLLRKDSAPFAKVLEAHIRAAETLSQNPANPVAKVWQEEAGATLRDFLKHLQELASGLGVIQTLEYPALVRALIENKVVRQPFSSHPRLAIMGTLEARLQTPDLIILGGLNEGSWPPEGPADPWMSREMRKAMGLPTPDQRTGQSAHDFMMALGAKEVVLTRSAKVEGTPATASRWLQRMTALLGGYHARAKYTWLEWYQALDLPDQTLEIPPPAPKPPAKVRPRKLSVTNIELLMRDPYAVYAKYILRLKPLDDLDADPSAADKGLILHEIFDTFLREAGSPLPKDAFKILQGIGQRVVDAKALSRPSVKVFWWPRFLRIAEKFIEEQRKREQTSTPLKTEIHGEWKITGAAKPFTVSATADRIDRVLDPDALVIIDYKTGKTATRNEIETGRKPQLALEGVMAEAAA